MKFLCYTCALLWAALVDARWNSVRVHRPTKLGNITGRIHEGQAGAAEVYLGIPFAQPPVGDLRFQYPVPVDQWPGRNYDATYERPWCVQFWYPDERLEKRHQSEDCLYMNIFVPFNSSTPPPYPVLLWIHGGSFQVGGANAFPINGTIENLSARGLIFVAVNYRLGPLGFMSSLSNDLAGNFGLEDQLIAIQWIRDNIADFDGDPTNVTIGGESAGAACVSILGVSPRAKGLISGLIIRSGSGVAPWAVRTINTDLNTNRLIDGLQCDKKHSDDTLSCLQSKNSEGFVKQWQTIAQDDLMLILSKTSHKPFNYNHPFLAHTYFTPVVDGYRMNDSIIPHYPEEMIKKYAHLPLMMGTTTGECTGYVTWLSYLEKAMGLNLHNLEYVVPNVQYINAEQVKQAVYKHYVGKNMWKPNFNFRKALVGIASDQNFVAPAALEARLYAEKGLPVYMYIFDHGNSELYQRHAMYGVNDVGASHGFDMIYLFQSTSVVDPAPEKKPLTWNDEDYLVTNLIAESTVNFSSYRNPNGLRHWSVNGSLEWPMYSASCRDALMIKPKLSLSDYNINAYQFWHETVATLQSLTLRQGYSFTPEIVCINSTEKFNYKVAFFVTLSIAVLLLLLLCLACFIQLTVRKEVAEKMMVDLNHSIK